MPQNQRRLPWVVGRLLIVNQRRPQALVGGHILLVTSPIPAVDGDMWIVQGELSNIRRLIRGANSDHLSAAASPLRLIGQFEGGARREDQENLDQQQDFEPDVLPRWHNLLTNLIRFLYILILLFITALVGFFVSHFI